MKKQTLYIKGMHCRSCELLLEDGISEIAGIKKVRVNYKNGTAEIGYKGRLNVPALQSVVNDAGYTFGRTESSPWITYNKEEWNQLSKAATALVIVYLIARWLGIFDLGSSVSSNYASLPVVFLVGLTAGISTCMAIVGGLVLGVSAKFAKQQPFASVSEKFTPHLMFNLGRIAAFFVLGGLIGLLGSVMQLSLTMVGFLTVLVGLSMLLLGAQLIEVFPRINGLQFTLPKSISRAFGIDQAKNSEYSHKNALLLGASTFFLPCGFTQAMQLYAISTGDFLAGALTMSVFAIGTAPGLLGIGGLTALVKGAFAKHFFKFAGLVVIALSLFNISNGLNLTGIKVSAGSMFATEEKSVLGVSDEAVVLKATYSNRASIQPTKLVTNVGQLTRLEITAQDNGAGCMSGVAIPGLTRSTGRLVKGQTLVFEFTPKKSGSYPLVCTSMGMYHGASVTVL